MSILSRIKLRLTLIKHRGQNVECPCCGYNARDLEEVGDDVPVLKERMVVGGGLRKAGCFKCGSYDRERLIFIYLSDELKIKNYQLKRVLHIAPERYISELFVKCGISSYVKGDKFTKGYVYPDTVKDMDLTALPFENNSFDLVIANHVLEHIPNDRDAMKEIFRVLNPGGQAILQVPFSLNSKVTIEDWSVIDPEDRKRVFGQFDHVRIYGQDYIDRLKGIGFNVSTKNISEKYKKAGLNLDEDIFFIVKPLN